MQVYIVIVTYNGMKWIEKCLNSIGKNYKVVVIDNNSKDNTVSFIEKNYSDIHLIKQSNNLGFGGANNIGISYALNHGADYVFLLNQDAYLIDSVIDDLIMVHKNNKDYGVLSPIHLNGARTKMDNNFQTYILNNKEYINDLTLRKKLNPIYEVSFVNAAAWLLSKDVLLKIGGFDPLFFHYGEDDNYCFRLNYHNIKVGFVPNTYILHDREFREKSKVLTLEESLQLKERFYKHNLANINDDFNKLYNRYKKDNTKELLFSLFHLKRDSFKYHYSHQKLLVSLKKQIKLSRTNNILIKANYLGYKK